MPDFPFFHFCR